MAKKKRQVRADFRKNRNVRARDKNWSRGVDPTGAELDDAQTRESVSGKGALSRKRTVAGAEIVDKSETRVLAQPPGETRLTLVTCYPFDALRAGGPLRYVVTAKAI